MTDDSEVKRIYRRITRRKNRLLLGSIGLLALLFIIDVCTGPALLSPATVFFSLFSGTPADVQTDIIVWTIRLPIAAMALVVGASLGTAGAELQTILDNPLASPYTLGISSAAAFGAALGILLGRNLTSVATVFIIPGSAFLFAILSSLLIYIIARWRSGDTRTLVLAGVVFSFLFHSLVSFLQYLARDNEFEAIVFWMFGSLQNATWTKVVIVAAAFCLCFPVLMSDAWKLTALRMGENKARSLGVNTEALRLKVMLAMSLMTAVSVCFVGTIGFIGLVAPHIARWMTGEDQRYFLPCSAIGGAIILSFASITSKMMIPGAIFPVGITTSFLGVPFLFYILFRKNGANA